MSIPPAPSIIFLRPSAPTHFNNCPIKHLGKVEKENSRKGGGKDILSFALVCIKVGPREKSGWVLCGSECVVSSYSLFFSSHLKTPTPSEVGKIPQPIMQFAKRGGGEGSEVPEAPCVLSCDRKNGERKPVCVGRRRNTG